MIGVEIAPRVETEVIATKQEHDANVDVALLDHCIPHILIAHVDSMQSDDSYPQEQEANVDAASSNQSITHSLITNADSMQLDDPYPQEYVKENHEALSINHQLDSHVNKSTTVDLTKLSNLIAQANIAAFDMEGKDVILFLGTTGSG